jgi:hypothetical protein
MQKLSGETMAMLYKSCSVFHQESNKIEFAFYEFSAIFYGFSKIQQKPKHYLRNHFACRPLERTQTLQLGPWAQAAATPTKFWRGAHRRGPWKGGVGSRAYLRPIWGVGWLEGSAGEGGWRREVVAVAAAVGVVAPASSRPGKKERAARLAPVGARRGVRQVERLW